MIFDPSTTLLVAKAVPRYHKRKCIGSVLDKTDHLRRRVRGFPLGFRVGFGTTRGLTLGVARFGGSDFPGTRRERVCVAFISKPPPR